MKNAFLILLLLVCSNAFAQSDVIINTATLCITEGRFNDAEKYLDSLLKIDPKNIDALMMKGNVLLNYAIMTTPPIIRITMKDESIYTENMDSMGHSTVLIPKDQAAKIEKIWKQCIDIDSGRLDIREGLCTLYGMADMKKELLAYLPEMAVAGKVKGDDFVAVLIQYAQLLSEREDKQGCYELYKKIASLYPTVSVVWCELSYQYHMDGDLANALICADKAFSMPANDPDACPDAVSLYSMTGDYLKALKLLKTSPAASFYEGIYKYTHRDTAWKPLMQEYLKQHPLAGDTDHIGRIASYMVAGGFKDDYNGFRYIFSIPTGSDFYRALILEKAIRDFKKDEISYVSAAQNMLFGKNYPKAVELFAELLKINAGKKDMYYQLEYAWALYCAKEYPKAITTLNDYQKITDPSALPVIYYFLGQCHLKSGNKDMAVSYFQKVVKSKDDSKYSYLAKLQLEILGVK